MKNNGKFMNGVIITMLGAALCIFGWGLKSVIDIREEVVGFCARLDTLSQDWNYHVREYEPQQSKDIQEIKVRITRIETVLNTKAHNGELH